MKLILFDIDGTMLRTNGVGRRSIEKVLTEYLGRRVDTDPVSFSGKTDPQILREIFAHNGTEIDDADLAEVLAAYTEEMHSQLAPETVTLLDGVPDLIEHLLPMPDVHLALLTGNLEPLAFKKLAAVGLDHHFSYGAFGSDHADRPMLPAIAIERAHAHTGHRFDGADVIIVGDTEHDIRCGNGVGAFSVAVATGHFTRDHLAQFEPDVLLDDLTDRDAFVEQVLRLAA